MHSDRTGASILSCMPSRRYSNLLDYQTDHLCVTMVNCVTEVSSSGMFVFCEDT